MWPPLEGAAQQIRTLIVSRPTGLRVPEAARRPVEPEMVRHSAAG